MADSPTIASDVAAGVKIDHRPWPGTKPGLRITREQMAKKIREGMHTPSVRALAGQILRDAGFPTTIRAKAEALRSYVKKHVAYAPDPMFSEMVVAAPITLCLDGVFCMPIADCDDATVACQSLIGAAGMDARFFHIDYGAGVQTHMMGAVRDEPGKWLEVDATTDRPVGYETSCTRKVLVDPFDDKTFDLMGAAGGSFIGVGKAFGGEAKPWDALPMNGYASAIFARRDVGAGAPVVLQKCDNFALSFTVSRSIGAPQATDIAQIENALAGSVGAGSFSGLSLAPEANYGSTVTGTYVGSTPLQFGPTLQYETAENFGGNTGWQNVTFTFTITSIQITGKSDTGPCLPHLVAQGPAQGGNGGQYNTTQTHTGGTQNQGGNAGGSNAGSSTSLSTGAKFGLAVGAVALLGGGAFAAYKAGWFGGKAA